MIKLVPKLALSGERGDSRNLGGDGLASRVLQKLLLVTVVYGGELEKKENHFSKGGGPAIHGYFTIWRGGE